MLFRPAPELIVDRWLNSAEPLSSVGLHARVVLIEALHMLCPGCVSLGLPIPRGKSAWRCAHRCSLLDVTPSVEDSRQICAEQEPNT